MTHRSLHVSSPFLSFPSPFCISCMPQAMFDEGLMTEEAMKGAWQVASKGANQIDFDAFLRLNVRLDLIMDEMEVMKETVAAGGKGTEDAEAFYRSEFKQICGSGKLMRLDMLVDWREVRELIDDKVVTEKQISKMFDGMPKEPMGIPANSMGITEDTFVAFNGMLDVLLDAGAGTSGPVRKEAAPSMLTNEAARPMPAVSELKMGSLETKPSAADDEASTGLTESELELMEQLDKADNMLNSGSFGDFDRLIGDVNDPRLQALRAERDGAEEVSGQLTDVLKELITLGKQQTRCGLDRPDEETQARIRDLVQAVVEKAPKTASRKIEDLRATLNGGWRLMFTNSEMFDFYNGVTGFANVFPAAKFDSLSVQYSSDGYLSEAQYVEKLNTPLGVIDATVFANWDLLKEMSFMTNENSVVLRNYCTKVRGCAFVLRRRFSKNSSIFCCPPPFLSPLFWPVYYHFSHSFTHSPLFSSSPPPPTPTPPHPRSPPDPWNTKHKKTGKVYALCP